MKNIQTKLIAFLCIFFAHTLPGSSQKSSTYEISYGVYRNYPPFSITKEELKEARTLIDLNRYYKPLWVKEYISVEILVSDNGKIKRAVSKNDTLSQEQKDIINRADEGTDISVKVHYLPVNTLMHNDPKEIGFTFMVEPENEAKYIGGQQQLKQYLQDHLMNKIDEASFRQYQLAVVKFTIDEEGQVTGPQIFWSSEDEKTDQILLAAVYDMPSWKPAKYANGVKVKQEFVLTVGDMNSCAVNLLNIRRE